MERPKRTWRIADSTVSRKVPPHAAAVLILALASLHASLPLELATTVVATREGLQQPNDWSVLVSDDFESGSTARWRVGSGDDADARWTIEADDVGHVYYGRGHITTFLQEPGWQDYQFKVRVKLLQGGLHLNFRDRNCLRYFIGFNRSELSLSRTFPCGTHTTLTRRPATHDFGRWYTVAVNGVGGTIKVYVDGALQIEYSDETPVVFGTIALESLTDSRVHVDDVEVRGPASTSLPGLVWTKTGGPLGGLGYDVRVRRDHPNIVLVTDAFSGVNISRDGGETWSASNTGILARAGPSADAIPVFSLTIDPRNMDVMWAGTQNVRGIFRSADGGQTWTQRDSGVVEASGLTIRGFTVDPIDSGIVYAAGEISSGIWAGQPRSGREFDLTKGVVYKTSDGGDTWAPIWRGNNLARYVWIDPTNPNVLYVSTGIFDREAANTDVATGTSGGIGILKSTDGGRTWRELNRSNGLRNLYVGSLFMHPTNSNILLAGAGNNAWSEGSGVYLSTDGGETWSQTLSSGPIGSVEFSLSHPNTAYAGSGSFIYRSDDGGRTWREYTKPNEQVWGPAGIRAGFPIDFDVDSHNPMRLFANVYGGGNFLSTDGGQTWRDASRGYTGAQMHTLAVDWSDPAVVYAGGRSAFFKSVDAGASWHPINYPPAIATEGAAVAISPLDRQHVLISDQFTGRLWTSRDGGSTWRTVTDYTSRLAELPVGDTNDRHQGFTAIAFAPSDPRIVYAGFAVRFCVLFNHPRSCQAQTIVGMHYSSDGGTIWRALANEGLQNRSVLSIAVHPHNPDVVYAATAGGGVLKSVDAGRTWASRNTGVPTLNVRSLVIDPRAPDTVYVGTEDAGLFKSSDGGTIWRFASTGLDPIAAIRAIVIDPTDSSTLWAADLRSGVYRSGDGGSSWVRVNNGLSTRAVRALAISSDGRTVYAGTEGEGVFRLDIPRPPSHRH